MILLNLTSAATLRRLKRPKRFTSTTLSSDRSSSRRRITKGSKRVMREPQHAPKASPTSLVNVRSKHSGQRRLLYAVELRLGC